MSKTYQLYFAACADDGGIYHYTFTDGALKFCEKTPCARPMYLDVTPENLQVVLQRPFYTEEKRCRNSALVTYSLINNVPSDPGPLQSTEGMEGCHLSRLGGHTYVANYSSGSLFSSSGKLVVHEGHGPNPYRQEMPHIHFVKPSPDGKYLLAVDLGLDAICTYDADLHQLDIAHVPAGAGPRHLAYSEDGHTVFCVNELDSSVTVFHYEDGHLESSETVDLLPEKPENNTAAAIRVYGSYVYASDRGDDSISVLKWENGKLTLQSVTKCGGVSPRDFLLVEDFLFCTNERTNNVTVFRAEGSKLTKLPTELIMPNPLCVVAL